MIETAMPSAISYIRFSSVKQVSSNSKQRQAEMIAGWLSANPDYSLSDLKFEDLGRSGYHGEHAAKGGGWAKLLAAVEAGAIKAGDVVLVEALDRTGRLETVDALHFLNPILRAGVSVITLDDGNVYNRESLNGPQIYLLVAKIQAAHGYSKILSERVKRSYQIRKEQARNGGPVKRAVPLWLTTDGKLKEHVAEQVKLAFELYVSGMGKIAIARRLRASGIEELSTCCGPTIDAWLQNKTAIGYWDDIPEVYPPAVSRELFLQAQKRRKDVSTPRPSKSAKHLLVGLVKCGVCGANYIMQSKGGTPHSMRCLTRQRFKDDKCKNTKTIPKNVLEWVRLQTSHFALNEALQKQQLTLSDKRRLEVEAEIEDLSSQISKIVSLLADVPDLPELGARLKGLQAQRVALQDELLVLERTEETLPAWETAYTESGMKQDDPERLNAMLKSVGYTISVFPDGLMTVSGEVFPFMYLGVKRSANAVLGFRVLWQGHEHLVAHPTSIEAITGGSPMPELKKPENAVEQFLMFRRRQGGVEV
jgi:DNA invertase Pin-like site-specific DNA recombinase|tara:strand:- start:843 stop:2444 length:1602 start_codon:yes stop_codon:yes gene_type:complete